MQVNLLAFTSFYARLLALIRDGFALPRRERGCLRPRGGWCYRPRLAFLNKAGDGGVAERLKAHAWKVCMRETVSRVRIPPPPPP